MKILNPMLVMVFAAVTLVAISVIAQSSGNQRDRERSGSRQQLEYATLTTQIVDNDNGQPVFQLTWNAGVVDFVGRSTISLEDARRRLAGQLRIGNNARANLSVLLTGIGQDGWRLIETTATEEGNIRVFVRASR